MWLRRVLGEPLLHFAVLGALFFALYARVGGDAPQETLEIVVDGARVGALSAQFERTWQRPPTPAELQGLVDGFVREEILYREGVALGLDRDDPIVRRRVGQKMDVLADAQADADVTDAALQAWLDAHADAYRAEPRTAFRQLFFDPQRRGDRLQADVAAARAALEAGRATPPGDASLLPARLDAATHAEIARTFGEEFAAALDALPAGGWQGPVASGYGVHLVEITAREPARTPPLAEVRDAVERDLLQARIDEANEAFYQALRARYRVWVEAGAATPPGDAPGVAEVR